MKARKFMLIMLGLLLVIMAACSSGNGGGGTEPGNNTPATASPGSTDDAGNDEKPEETIDPNVTPEMDFDMGGRTIKLVSWYDESIPEDSPDNIQRKANLEQLMEKHNFKVEYIAVDYGEHRDKATASLMAGEPVGDIIRLARPWMIPSLVKQDLFWPLDEYVINDRAFVLQYTKEHSLYNGRGYGFRIGIAGASSGIFYNRTLMNQLGMKPLQEYMDEGNWNWDTFIEIAKSANMDTNNDGTIDTWGLTTNSLLVPALAANETNMAFDGKQALDDPKTREVLEFISRMGTEGVARPTEGGDWTEPMQFFLQGNTLMHPGSDYESDSINDTLVDSDIGFLPFPKGPSATAYHSFNTIPNYYTIPRAVPNPEQIIYIWEKIYDIDSVYDYPKQAALETFFSNEVDVSNAKLAGDSIRVVDGADAYPTMPYYEFVDELRSGVSVSTIIEKYRETFQAAIDEVWSQ